MMKKFFFFLVFLIAVASIFVVLNNRESGADFIDAELAEIEGYIAQRDVKNTGVSQADVAWHLDHSLKVLNNLCETLEQSNPEEFSSEINASRLLVFTTGIIPRGRAQAPESVRPPEVITDENIELQLASVRSRLANLSSLDEKAHTNHPVFGTIDKGQTMRLMKVHTRHHLKIIADIVRGSN